MGVIVSKLKIDEPLVTTKEAAKILNVSETSIRRWTKNNLLKSYRVGFRDERRFLLADLESFLRGDSRASKTAEPSAVNNHFCLLHGCDESRDGLITSFINETSREENKIVYLYDDLTSDHSGEAVISQMVKLTGKEELSARQNQIVFLRASETYLLNGYFDPDRMLNFMGKTIRQALQDGYRQVFLAGEMTWYFSNFRGVAQIDEYELNLNKLCTEFPQCSIHCQYDISRFNGSQIVKALETHSVLRGKGYQYHRQP